MSKKIIICCLIFLFKLIPSQVYSQSNISYKNNKIGLVLSGGGAKGLAHIGLLRMIDSLNIKVDYISATSMGGVIGSLYAMGYSADSIKNIVLNLDWNQVFTNKVPLRDINIEEKNEYDNYIIELPITKGKPSIPSYLLEGRSFIQLLNKYLFPARNIRDFSKLKIPINLTSSDIVNGGLVIQKDGYLPIAVMSTFAIPTFFSPIRINGKLLVDGGLERNFPVDEVISMGAEYVIGSYTGFRLYTESELENPMRLIAQTHAFQSIIDSKKQIEKSNIFLDHNESLKLYSSSDFTKYKEIVEVGELEARKLLPKLLEIAKIQKQNNTQRTDKQLINDNSSEIKYIDIKVDRGNEKLNNYEHNLVNNNNSILNSNNYNAENLNDICNNIYGSRNYDNVFYTFNTKDTNQLILNLHLKRTKAGSFKFGVHYDTEQSSGILLNYTYRNLLLDNSRILATVDLSERFKARINYYKFIDHRNKVWFRFNSEFRNVLSNDILYKFANYLNTTTSETKYYNNLFTNNLGLCYSLNKNSYFEGGVEYDFVRLTKKNDDIYKFFFNNIPQKTLFEYDNLSFYLQYNQNSLNTQYYPTKGNQLTIETKFFKNLSYEINNPTDTNNVVGRTLYELLSPDLNFYNKNNNRINFLINERYIQKLTSKLSLVATFFAGINYITNIGFPKDFDNNYSFPIQRFVVGGFENRQSYNNPQFWGLKQEEFQLDKTFITSLNLQYNVFNKIYLTPGFCISQDYTYGYGLDVGYMSIIGPIKFNISRSSILNTTRAYFSLGFKF